MNGWRSPLHFAAARKDSFKHAFRGFASAFREEANLRIHGLATLAVLIAAGYFGLRPWEWCAVASAIAAVIVAEMFNTALESLTDLVTRERHPLAGGAKDAAAGAVLAAAVYAVAVGLLVFGPRLLAWCGGWRSSGL